MTIRAFAIISLLLSGIAMPAWADEAAGQVQIVVGAAQLIDGMGKQRPLERGTEIRQGDRIVTGDGALVQLKLTDGTYVSVRTNTDVAVEKYKYDEKSAQGSSLLLKLAQGALRSITGFIGSRSPEAYKVVTPTATIGIRGTDHEPVFIPEPKAGEIPVGPPGTYDKVNSGATFIQTPAGSVEIRPGQVGFVPVLTTTSPKLLPAVPDFFKKLDGKDGGLAARKPGLDGKGELRSPLKTLGGSAIEPNARLLSPGALESANQPVDPASPILAPSAAKALAVEGTLTPTTTLAPAAASTTLAPLNATISPNTAIVANPAILQTISPAPVQTISPMMVQTISPTIAPAIAPTVSPTVSPTTIQMISPTILPTIKKLP